MGTWLTDASSTIVASVASTSLVTNSWRMCSAKIFSISFAVIDSSPARRQGPIHGGPAQVNGILIRSHDGFSISSGGRRDDATTVPMVRASAGPVAVAARLRVDAAAGSDRDRESLGGGGLQDPAGRHGREDDPPQHPAALQADRAQQGRPV